MRKAAVRTLPVLFALVIGFCLGRVTNPFPVKATTPSATRVVRIPVSDSAVVPGSGIGPAVGISCVSGSGGSGDCYVLLQGSN